jgi:hypothetical protein
MTRPVEIDVENDGARNAILNINICLDQPKMEPVVILDKPTSVDRFHHPTTYRIDHLNYVLHKDLVVDLWWEDEPPKLIRHLEGRGMMDRHLHNKGSEKKTGRVLMTAYGWKAGNPLFGSITIEAVKQ